MFPDRGVLTVPDDSPASRPARTILVEAQNWKSSHSIPQGRQEAAAPSKTNRRQLFPAGMERPQRVPPLFISTLGTVSQKQWI